MNLHELSTEDIKKLLNVEKVLKALLDKILDVESQIIQNREQIDLLNKSVTELSNKIISMDISNGNEFKMVKNENTTINQKLFGIDKQLSAYSKQLSEIEEELVKLEKQKDEDEEDDKDEKKKSSASKTKVDLKSIVK